MAEYLAMDIMKKMGVSTEEARAQVGYKKEFKQVEDLVAKHGENAVKQVFMTTHDASDLASNMMFDQSINPSPLAKIAPTGKPIIDFDKTAKKNGKHVPMASGFREATFNIDEYKSNRRR
jgi:hypothetical protein